MYTAGRLSTPESKKSSPFLRRVKWRKAMYHNKIDTLHLVRVVTSGQMINSKFFPLGTWCHPLMWFETQSTVKRKVFTNFAMQSQAIIAKFSQICLFGNCLCGGNDGKWPALNHKARFVTYSAYSLCVLLTFWMALPWYFDY